MLVIFPTVCLLFESLLQVGSSIYFLYSSLAIFLNDLCHLYLFVFLMSEPVSLIELSKIVSLCTLVSKKNKKFGCILSLYVYWFTDYIHVLSSVCVLQLSKANFFLYCALKISVNRGANLSTAQWRESSVHSPRNLGVLHDTWCRPIIGLLNWPGGDVFYPVTAVCISVSLWPLSVLVKRKVAKGQTLALLTSVKHTAWRGLLIPTKNQFLGEGSSCLAFFIGLWCEWICEQTWKNCKPLCTYEIHGYLFCKAIMFHI